MSEKNITVEEWLAELGKVSHEKNGASLTEIAAATGVSRERVRLYLAKLRDEGRLLVGRKVSIGIDNANRPVPTYRIKPAEKPGKKK